MANQWSESDDDFVRMQQEAIRRVRDMQSRARATLENAGMHIENHNNDMPIDPPVMGYHTPTFSRVSESSKHEEPRRNERDEDKSEDEQNERISKNEHHETATERNQNEREIVNEKPEREKEIERHEQKSSKTSSSNADEKRSPTHSDEKHIDPLGAITNLIHNPMINLSLESDQIMLMILIYMLVQDGADKWLILSLAYVLMT